MLLPAKKPTCADDLQLATDVAGQVLDYAAAWPDEPFDKDNFCKQLERGTWLMSKPAPVVSALRDLFKLRRVKRVALCEAFLNDMVFCDHLDDPDFDFLFRQLSNETREVGKALLVSFYEEILGKAGFTGLSGQKVNHLDRAAFEKGYREANGVDARICPACLGELPPPVKGRTLVDREHFFPKSLYPPLAVHPVNLILTCLICNERMHGEEDPIEHHAAGALRESFVPYLRSGLDEIELRFSPGSPSATVRLEGKAALSHGPARVKNFDRLYGLSQRWSAGLHMIHDVMLERCWIACVERTPTQQDIEIALKREVLVNERFKTSGPGAYLAGQYATWLLRERMDCLLEEVSKREMLLS
jgi:hypothetical protein